jgi:hypothetical protein
MKKLGTVLVFKAGTSKEEALKALQSIAAVLDSAPSIEQLHKFDASFEGPVWYIP